MRGRCSDNRGGRGSRFEISTQGRDPALALFKGNPYGTTTGPGLIIPSTPSTETVLPAWTSRYLFLLAQASFNPGEVVRLIGLRQYLTLGTLIVNTMGESPYNYVLEQPVVTPTWHFSDANVSWHLRRVDPQSTQVNQTLSPFNGPSYCFRQGMNPALLFESDFSQPDGYLPPFGGTPPGNILTPDLGSWQDIRFPWQGSDSAWTSLDIQIKGPCMVALFASVQQSVPGTRPTLSGGNAVPTAPNTYTGGLGPEESFLLNFPNAVYYRIMGSLIFERPPFYDDDFCADDDTCYPGGRGRPTQDCLACRVKCAHTCNGKRIQ